tara:strand:- start:300 stop:536 length:237 start_codon:yes stop_codon:yes gene_type:complete
MRALKLFGLFVYLSWIGVTVCLGALSLMDLLINLSGYSIESPYRGYLRGICALLAYSTIFAVVHPALKVEKIDIKGRK